MFGFSITKLVFTVIIVVVVWQAFKYFTRVQDQREKRSRVDGGQSGKSQAGKSQPGVEDMVKCSVCESYVARGSQSCGQEGCPFRG